MKKMAKAMAVLKVAKIVVKDTEPEARLLYRLMSLLGGQAVPPIEAWPGLRVEALGYVRPEVQKVVTRGLLVCGDELMSRASGRSSGEAVVEEG